MTPILRRSKESARIQRSKPLEERKKAVPTSRPLSSSHSSRGPPPREGLQTRKRRFMDDGGYGGGGAGGRGRKFPRGDDLRGPPRDYRATDLRHGGGYRSSRDYYPPSNGSRSYYDSVEAPRSDRDRRDYDRYDRRPTSGGRGYRDDSRRVYSRR